MKSPSKSTKKCKKKKPAKNDTSLWSEYSIVHSLIVGHVFIAAAPFSSSARNTHVGLLKFLTALHMSANDSKVPGVLILESSVHFGH